jgi:arylsulfatase A-like enzyme
MSLFFLLSCVVPEQENTVVESIEPVEQIIKETHPPSKPPIHNQRMNAPPRKGYHPSPTLALVGEKSDSPKSIVIISLDTVRADRLSVYGGRAEAPSLSRFAEEGALFEQAISHFPETALSHWSLLSGVLPEVHGNVPSNSGSIYSGPMIADIVKEQGFSTAAFIGGVTLQDSACGLNRNFDVYDDAFTYSPDDMSRPGKEVTQKAMEWISAQNGPYFAFVHYFDAHFPYTPSPPWDTQYDPTYTGSIDGSDAVLRPFRDGQKSPTKEDVEHVLALYDGELSELDQTIAPLLESLDSNTLVVVTSDHGESFEHGYYFNHRGGLWDGITHVPLIIRGPGVTPTRIKNQVGLIDVLPTLLELAGLQSDANIQGQSMVSLLSNKGNGRDAVYSITDPWMPNPQFSVRTKDHKRIEGRDIQVYDLNTDPAEQSPMTGSESVLSSAKEDYERLISNYKARQLPNPNPQVLDPESCAALEALGYTTCDTPK